MTSIFRRRLSVSRVEFRATGLTERERRGWRPLARRSPLGTRLLTPNALLIVVAAAAVVYSVHVRGGHEERSYLYQRAPVHRRALLEQFDAHEKTEDAINLGLEWLAAHQVADGSWRTSAITCPSDDSCSLVRVSDDYADALTGLSLLAFLGRGVSEIPEGPSRPEDETREERFSRCVGKAVQYLVGRQDPEDGSWGGGYMYAQGICTLALVEANALSPSEELRSPIQKSLAFIAASQSTGGGWDYYPRGDRSDTSITAWVLLALFSARSAGHEVEDHLFLNALRHLHDVTDAEQRVGYVMKGDSSSPTLVAIGLFSRLYMGYRPDSQPVRTQSQLVLDDSSSDYYFWYHASLGLFQMQDLFPAWKARVQDTLIDAQSVAGHMRGSWDPGGGWTAWGRRVLATALCTMSLEVYFRHLLLYRHPAQFPVPYTILTRFPDETIPERRRMLIAELGHMVSDAKIIDFLEEVARTDYDETIRQQAAGSLRSLRTGE